MQKKCKTNRDLNLRRAALESSLLPLGHSGKRFSALLSNRIALRNFATHGDQAFCSFFFFFFLAQDGFMQFARDYHVGWWTSWHRLHAETLLYREASKNF